MTLRKGFLSYRYILREYTGFHFLLFIGERFFILIVLPPSVAKEDNNTPNVVKDDREYISARRKSCGKEAYGKNGDQNRNHHNTRTARSHSKITL